MSSLAPAPVAAPASAVHPRGGNAPAAREWEHRRFPGKRATEYTPARKAGRDALVVRAAASASMLRHRVHVPPQALSTVRFSWFLPALIDAADLHERDADDSPLRIVLAFEGDRSRFSTRDAALSELAHALTGEPMPYATLMYVWSNASATDAVVRAPRTDRIRSIVVESGAARLNRWIDYERDIRADFERAFGEAPGALVGVALLSDTDNTGAMAQAWYGPLSLSRRSAQQSVRH
ncbi:DUF3047 domain-containing protein [Ramlibacter sp. AN1015]|uniref:DUF3047 domain-containing protein n=1 Tax=Ramlibacter sp. AN1015 TaxID=3133428 RepID=UPI0030BB8F8A